ncbi:uncharacterized protein [Apostichopus japonicus]|uniref:uncharacterized protein n=1 Tax=Stichopus japonicus TaxID=307972 RepID=UPI003AB3B658
MAIGYLPLALVRLNFWELVTNNSTQCLVACYPAMQQFIQYLENNYISDNGNFPAQLWNVFHRDNDTRTNNHVEGFHQRWNNIIGRAHPSLWLFLRKMKDEQHLLEITVASAGRGEAPPHRRRKWRTLQQRITRLRDEYLSGKRTLQRYWNAVVFYLNTLHV